MAKILLVEDDPLVIRTVKSWLEMERHTVEKCANGTDALSLINSGSYDLVILDWELPGMSGIDVLRSLRADTRKTYILMLTGKTRLNEKEAGLDEGADDYLTKPFELRELSARVRALLRRTSQSHSPVLTCRDLSLDPSSGRVMRGEVEIRLMPTEYALLEFFLRHPDKLFSVDDLLDRVWGSESEASVIAVRTYMTRLRKKIDVAGNAPYIVTVHGLGYKLVP